MIVPQNLLPHALASVRIVVGLLFILFGQFKVFGDEFVHGMVRQYVEAAVQGQAASFYGPLLEAVVLPRPELFGYLVAWGELLIGLSLVSGLLVRAASVAGAVHMLGLTLATWNAPGAQAPLWQYWAGQLDHLGLLFLFILFLAGNAGETWGLDGLRRGKRKEADRA